MGFPSNATAYNSHAPEKCVVTSCKYLVCHLKDPFPQFVRLCTSLEKSSPKTLNPGSFPSRINLLRIWVISNDKTSLGISISLDKLQRSRLHLHLSTVTFQWSARYLKNYL